MQFSTQFSMQSSTQPPHTRLRRRAKGLASAVAGLTACGTVLTVTALGAGPASSAAPEPPAADCAVPAPASSLTEGQPVTGLTVTSGTTPESFSGEVIGVLEDGIGPGRDMVMVRLSSPEIDRVGGIWQGMSGSPVYDADHHLVGAVAYGLAWGPSPVAGVTPFADMNDYFTGTPDGAQAPARTVAVGSRDARTIAQRSPVTRTQAAEGFAQLPMPLGVSGLGARRLQQAQDARSAGKHPWLPKDSYAMGSAAAPGDGPAADTVVAGGNMAASLSYGDVTQAGVGTVTSVCDGRVVGFGHPMSFLGRTSLSLHPADALYVQEDSLGAPFKVANLGAPVGTVTDDRATGITGSFGPAPAAADVSSTVRYAGRSRTGESHVSVPSAVASTVFYQDIANHDRVVDGMVPGTELLTWTVAGHDADGAPFELSVTDRYTSDADISFESVFELSDFVYSLSSLPGLELDTVSMDSDVVDDHARWQVDAVEQRVDGAWQRVGKGHPVRVDAGGPLAVRAVLTGPGGATTTVPVSVDVPRKAAGGRGRLMVVGGSQVWSRHAYPSSLEEAEKYVDTLTRNDQVHVVLDLYGKRRQTERTADSAPGDRVVTGHKQAKVRVSR